MTSTEKTPSQAQLSSPTWNGARMKNEVMLELA